jgi:hypothetical protein
MCTRKTASGISKHKMMEIYSGLTTPTGPSPITAIVNDSSSSKKGKNEIFPTCERLELSG